MATAKTTPDPFDDVRDAFADLGTSEKAAFVLEATFETLSQALAETGRRAVFVNPYHTVRILGMAPAESDALLDEIFAWCERPEFQWEHHWRLGDTVVWENRCAWHQGPRDYPTDQHRVFLRATVRGAPTR